MGASIHYRSRRGRQQKHSMVGEINVTPFVDVVLVLLIVFMVTAPLMTIGVPLDLPETQAKSLTDQVEPLTVSLDKEGRLYIQETELEFNQLVPRLSAISGANNDMRIFVRGDTGLQYGEIIKIMGAINAAGYNKVALLANLPKAGSGKGTA